MAELKMPRYFSVGRVYKDKGKIKVKVTVKWWAYPFWYFKCLKKLNLKFLQWVFAIFYLPLSWYKAYKAVKQNEA